MPRKITTNDWKDKRDYNAWKLEVDGHSMSETRMKYDEAVAELARRENKRIGVLKDTLWDAMVPFVGINITPPELKEAIERIMNSNGIEDIVLELMTREEERVKDIEVAENVRLDKLKNAHEKLVNKLEKIRYKDKSEEPSATDSDGSANEVSPTSESKAVTEEPSEVESETDEYMTESEELDTISEDDISKYPET